MINLRRSLRDIISYIGDDFHRDGLLETPDRMARSWKEIFDGYGKDPSVLFKTFDAYYDQMIIQKNIDFFSMCEHHFLPFLGRAHIAYIPTGSKVVGASKLIRLFEIYAHRLQLQERIGERVTDDLMEYLKPQGAACIIEATHLCEKIRGVKCQGAELVTSSLKGVFFTSPQARMELMELIKR